MSNFMGGVHVVQEPYDSVVRILSQLQLRAATKKDLTGTIEAANQIMELFEPPITIKPKPKGQ